MANVISNLILERLSQGADTLDLAPITYNIAEDIIVPNNFNIVGTGSSVIDFGGGAFSVIIEGTNSYAVGTITISFGNGNVIGTGTTWNSGMVGRSILIGDYWYEITAFNSVTNLSINPSFIGTNLVNDTYVIADTANNISLNNLTISNSSTTALRYRYADGLTFDKLATTGSGQGHSGMDSANVNIINGSFVDDCVVGIVWNNVPFGILENTGITSITGGVGIDLTRVSNTSMGVLSVQGVTGVGIRLTNCYDLGLINFAIIECSSHGLEFVSGNRDMDAIAGYIDGMGGDGIKLTTTSDSIGLTNNSIKNCTGFGINIAATSCDGTILVNITTANNTAGALNDTGTGTLKSATVNILV